MIGEYKLKHIVVSAIITVVLNPFLSWRMAVILTTCIDVSRGHSKWKDLLADVVGILVGIL